MIRVTADTNIYISGLVFAGMPRQFIQAAERGQIRLAVLPPLMDEIRRILTEKFRWTGDTIDGTFELLSGCTTIVHPKQAFDAVPTDPDDNRVQECAVESGSHFIVTGDKDLDAAGSAIVKTDHAYFLATARQTRAIQRAP